MLIVACSGGDNLAGASDTDALQFKMLYEKEIKNRINGLLEKIVGGKKYYAEASVEISPTVERTTSRSFKTDPAEKIDSTIWQLFGENTSKVEQKITESKHKLTGVSITVILDESVDEVTEAEVKDSVLRIFKGLKENSLYIRKMKFTGTGFLSFFEERKAFLLLLVAALVFLGFLFGPLRSFMKGILAGRPASRVIDIKMEKAGFSGFEGSKAPGSVVINSENKSSVITEPGKAEIEERPFAFISRDNLKNLAIIIQNESPDVISLILSYLKEEDAALIVGYFEPEVKAKIALSMLEVKQTNKESVRQAEGRVKDKLDFLVGGIDKFTGILEKMDAGTRDSILSALFKDSPEVAGRFKNSIFTFDSIAELPDEALQLALKEIQPDILAKALNGASETLFNKFNRNLSEGKRARLKEEIDLTGYITPIAIEKERSKILKLFHALESEGILQLPVKDKTLSKITVSKAGKNTGVLRDGEERVGLSYYENQDDGKMMSLRKIFKRKKADDLTEKDIPERLFDPEKK